MIDFVAAARDDRFNDLRQALLTLANTAACFDDRSAPSLSPIVVDLAAGRSVSDQRMRSLARTAPSALASDSKVRVLPPLGPSQKATAVVPMRGVALYDLDWQPYYFSTQLLARTIDQLAADPQIGTIILDCDSPGGAVTGTKEAGDAVWSARKKKRVVALVNPFCASAAYWICSQATAIVGVPSSGTGSIGVLYLHVDLSEALKQAGVRPTYVYAGEHKVDGNPYEPLKPEARDWIQRGIDKIYREFVGAVARGRQVSSSIVLARFGQGRVFQALEAKRVGMIDGIETPDRALSAIVAGRSILSTQAAAAISNHSHSADDAWLSDIRRKLALEALR